MGRMGDEERGKIIRILRETILWMILVFVCITYTLTMQTVKVEGESMEPTFQSGQVRVLIKNPAKIYQDDFLVFSHEPHVNPKNKAIKRVVGVGGDTVMYTAGMLSINGIERPEYSDLVNDEHLFTDIIQLDYDEYWVLGDNKGHNMSLDSRVIGKVEGKWVVGKLLQKRK